MAWRSIGGARAAGCMDSSLRWRARSGRIFAARAMAKAGRTSLRSLRSRPVLCAGLSTIPSPTGDRRSSKINLLRTRRRDLCAGGGSHGGARPFPDQASGRRERHGRFRLYAVSSRGVHRVGRDLWNCVLGASVRRRRNLPGSRPHRDRRRRQRQFLVAFHDQSLLAIDGP